jgi:hypothetical protein
VHLALIVLPKYIHDGKDYERLCTDGQGVSRFQAAAVEQRLVGHSQDLCLEEQRY